MLKSKQFITVYCVYLIILFYKAILILLLTSLSSVVSSFIFSGKTITNAPALLLMDWKTDGVISRAFATTQCLEVLHPVNDLASREIGALRQPCENHCNFLWEPRNFQRNHHRHYWHLTVWNSVQVILVHTIHGELMRRGHGINRGDYDEDRQDY